VGSNNEHVEYKDIDVTLFDMNGISNKNSVLDMNERRKVLEEIIPAKILADYDSHWRNAEQSVRINHYKLTRWIFWFY